MPQIKIYHPAIAAGFLFTQKRTGNMPRLFKMTDIYAANKKGAAYAAPVTVYIKIYMLCFKTSSTSALVRTL